MNKKRRFEYDRKEYLLRYILYKYFLIYFKENKVYGMKSRYCHLLSCNRFENSTKQILMNKKIGLT